MPAPTAPFLDRLRNIPLFATCTDRQLEAINAMVEELEIPAGRILVQEGQPLGNAFIVAEGEASVSIAGVCIGGVGAGAVVGESTLVGASVPRSTVVADTPMRLLRTDPRSLSEMLSFGDVALKMMRGVADRLRAVQRAAEAANMEY